jgi:hypothetical protein
VILSLNAKTGEINNFLYVNKSNDESPSRYGTYQAIYHDTALESYILAFKKDSSTYVMRINDKPITTVVPPYHAIVWNFQMQNTQTDWRVQNNPRLFWQDT